MAPPFSPWPKASCFQFEGKYFKGPSFQGSDLRSSILHNMAASVLAARPGWSSRGGPAASCMTFLLRLPVHIHTAASSPDDLYRLPLMLMFLSCLPSSCSSSHPASLQGLGCRMPGFSLAPHSLHSQSMSVPSPGALALLVEAAVFPPIPSHPRCIQLLRTRDIQRWWMLYSPQTAVFLCRMGADIMASCSKDDFLVSCWSCCPRTRKQVCSIHPPHTTVHRASCTCALSVHIRRHARVSSSP